MSGLLLYVVSEFATDSYRDCYRFAIYSLLIDSGPCERALSLGGIRVGDTVLRFKICYRFLVFHTHMHARTHARTHAHTHNTAIAHNNANS